MALEGIQLGQYRLIRLLGSGGMGEVYLAEDARINQQVAIKVSRTDAASYPNSDITRDAVRLFQREARAIARLDHPHILPLFSYGEENVNGISLTYIVMPFRREGSLANWLQEHSSAGLLSPQDVAYFIIQAAEALQYAHNNQIVHQDVKPSNFLIRTNPENPNRPDLLLADFGIARLSSATTSVSHSIRGTPAYMAPEQWSGDPVLATDQYALAVMAYELLTGRPPFQGSPMRMMYLHANALPQAPSTHNSRLSTTIDVVIVRALAKNPAERFPSIAAFADAYQQASQTDDSSTVVRSPNVPPSIDLQATLGISKAEAQTGTSRILTLPGGRQVTVNVPASAYDGQVLRIKGMGEPTYEGGARGALILTLSVQDTEEILPPSNSGNTDKTVLVPNSGTTGETVLPRSTANSGKIAPVSDPSTPVPDLNAGFQKTSTQPGPNNGKVILFIGLALLVLVASIAIFYFQGNNRSTTNSPDIAATIHAADATSFAATATTQADNTNATAQTNNVNATATTQVNATATTQAANTNATATALNTNTFPPPGATVVLNDPLSDNSQGHGWEIQPGSIGACQFTGGVYQVYVTQRGDEYCPAYNTSFGGNFAYEVQMTITQGDLGGLIVRDDTHGISYYFRFRQNGDYDLAYYYNSSTHAEGPIVASNASPFHTGYNQSNLIGAVVRGNSIQLYVNRQFINSVNVGNYGSGYIGVFANDKGNPTEAIFSNAKVWTF
ncbi:MAG: serine/threonine protein kinase [Ktedonobacteraceae bacterium]